MSAGSARVLFLFAVVGFLLYGTALKNPFHYDDLHSIRYNPHIRSLENMPRFFVDLHTFSSERSGTMFRPLLLCTYALNYALNGQDAAGYRLFNLALHVLCAWMVWSLAKNGGGAAMALLAGGVFLLHPLAAEPINYISSRSDILMTAFVLSAVLCFAEAKGKRLWLLLALFAAGLLVKSVAIVLPALCFLSLRGAWTEGTWRHYWGRFAAMAILALTYLGIIVSNRFLTSSIAKAPRAFDVNILTQAKAYVYSVWLYAMPVHLNVDHPFTAARALWEPQVLCALLFLLSLLVFFARFYKQWFGMGGLFFIAGLLPYALIPLNIMVSERRVYLAGVGFALLASHVFVCFFVARRRSASAVAAVAILSFVSIIAQRNGVWSADIRLWEDAVRSSNAQPRARVNLALAYGRDERWNEAREQLGYALAVDENFADAWMELGNIEHRSGALVQAESAYLRALKSQPALAGGHYNLGNILMAKGDARQAVERYAKALQLSPNFAMAHNNIGQAYEALGREEGALEHYKRALAIDPDQPQAWFNWAVILERRGQVEEARRAYLLSYKLLRDSADYEHNEQFQQYAQRASERASRLAIGQ